MMRTLLILWTVALLCGLGCSWAYEGPQPNLTFCCSPRNDLFLALRAYHFRRYDRPLEAIQKAKAGSVVLLLADEYPEHPLRLDDLAFALVSEKRLRLFLEYPASVPGLKIGAPRSTAWERFVVASEGFAPALPRLRILAAHGCRYMPVSAALAPDLVVARVAGYDSAIFGIPAVGTFSILFEVPERNWIVATTKLSGFITGRYAPVQDWEALWNRILSRLCAGAQLRLEFQPLVQSAYGRESRLPRRYESEAFDQAAHWFGHSHLLVHASEKEALDRALAAGGETAPGSGPGSPEGDGSLGILEGYASGISPDGNQPRRLPLRADCQAESAMVLALDALLNGQAHSRAVARNLLDFLCFTSGLCQGPRADPHHPAFGLSCRRFAGLATARWGHSRAPRPSARGLFPGPATQRGLWHHGDPTAPAGRRPSDRPTLHERFCIARVARGGRGHRQPPVPTGGGQVGSVSLPGSESLEETALAQWLLVPGL